MREIIFRGKRVDNGEWVEGYLVHSDLIRNHKQSMMLETTNMSTEGEFNCHVFRVDPATVGQYILRDKNGKRIFDGDVLRYTKFGGHISTGVVKYAIEFARWEYWHTEQKQGFPVLSDHDNMEVIGNIYDNQELLITRRD